MREKITRIVSNKKKIIKKTEKRKRKFVKKSKIQVMMEIDVDDLCLS